MSDFSRKVYDSLHDAFDHFNETLFDNRLPPVMITLHRKRNARGYFWADQWRREDDDDLQMPEIALNPEHMGRTPAEVLSTLVHEMVHHQQQVEGTPPKSPYHNKEWASMMDAVGLQPTTTGTEDGARTGRNCTHLIEAGGRFAVSCEKLLERNDFDISWFTVPKVTEKKKDLSKVKHICPDCGDKVWGKQGIYVVCGTCDERMTEAV